jgi:hypothetical protein
MWIFEGALFNGYVAQVEHSRPRNVLRKSAFHLVKKCFEHALGTVRPGPGIVRSSNVRYMGANRCQCHWGDMTMLHDVVKMI